MGKKTETGHTQKSNNRKVTPVTKILDFECEYCKKSVQKFTKNQLNQHFSIFGTSNALYMAQR